MTKRLEQALKQLTPEQVEQLTALAEGLAPRAGGPNPGDPPRFDWVGCLRNAPERSGLEAQKRTGELRVNLLKKNAGL